MKITILNGSPRHNGNTQIMADTFSETARENGHTVNILNIANMNIRGCLGCKYCYSHGGKCVQDDDMENVLAELSDTDMVVFASPVYWFDMTAQLKTVYLKWEDKGIITVPNMLDKGSMKACPKLEDIRKLAASL